MLELRNAGTAGTGIFETASVTGTVTGTITGSTGQPWPYTYPNITETILWNNYPVYCYTDRTEKAINVLKALEAEKVIEVKSVKRFIELVEKIKGLI